MSELEKVIEGIEACNRISGNGSDCQNCPYYDDEDASELPFGVCNIHDMLADALALLKAQIPRVMTADEIKSDYVEIFYFETRAGMLRGCVKELSNLSGSSIVYLVCGLDDDIYWRALDGYEITWRAWTRRPSFEQMANTPWEGSEADGKN